MTRSTRRRLAAAAAVLSGSLAFTAHAQGLDGVALVEPGKITYGVAASFAPFEFVQDGKLSGFDIEFIDALAEKLGVETSAMNMEFKGLIPALQGGRIDIINSAMYINPTRSEQVDFVPYLKIGNNVLVQAGNPKGITGRDDSICGKVVAVTLGGISESQARADGERCKAAGLGDVTVMTLPTAQDSALSLSQGRADANYESTPGAVMALEKMPGVFEIAGEAFEEDTQIGIATPKGATALQEALAAAIQSMVEDGSYDALIAKWNLPASVSLFR
ncbi:ABC transporter substrate-binding protein [Pseudogemmobacter sonorensis]|uniref:ABC transporter substrate-binding protein n=1 Tax=Pseudogemmobacter sonorensis TaxID=2989681 RepID=UPI00367C2B81